MTGRWAVQNARGTLGTYDTPGQAIRVRDSYNAEREAQPLRHGIEPAAKWYVLDLQTLRVVDWLCCLAEDDDHWSICHHCGTSITRPEANAGVDLVGEPLCSHCAKLVIR